ncbi:MAG: HAMP domain-containing sensor histidine kinase [Myxococcota bacterium]
MSVLTAIPAPARSVGEHPAAPHAVHPEDLGAPGVDQVRDLLADAATLLHCAGDLAGTLSHVARLPLGRLAEACAVFLRDDAGEFHLAETAGDAALMDAVLPRLPLSSQPWAEDAEVPLSTELGGTQVVLARLRSRENTLGGVVLLRRPGFRLSADTEVILRRQYVTCASAALQGCLRVLRAEEELRARDEFVAIASHELCTPVASLRLQVDCLERRTRRSEAGVPAEVLGTAVDRMRRQTDRLALLIRGILDVSRVGARTLELERTEVDLAALVHDVVKRMHPELALHGCTVHVAASPSLRGCWDRERVEQVVGILLVNAMRYGASGPVEVRVSCAGDTATVALTAGALGIPRQELRHLFCGLDRRVMDRQFAALGLGLVMARRLTHAHGGALRAECRPGQGTTFVVELPLGRG